MNIGQDKNKGPRACTTCARAKARCIPGPEGTSKCERCHRLAKPCASQVPAPPRAKKGPKPTRVAALERRLEDLASQLHAVQPPVQPAEPELVGSSFLNPSRPSAFNFNHIFPSQSQAEGNVDSSDASTSPSSKSTPDTDFSVGGKSLLKALPTSLAARLPRMEADALLADFLTELQPLYPFVVVPPHMTSADLAAERPYLWKAIVMAASMQNGRQQVIVGDGLIKDITEATFIRSEKSLDVLQALLCLLAWYHYNMTGFQLTNFLFLARSICVGLGLRDGQVGRASLEEDPSHALELMRAYTGCYYLNTIVFTTNKRPDAFMNMASLQQCCNTIRELGQYPSDELLVQLIGIQKLAHSISMTLGSDISTFQTMQLPLVMVVQSFQQQLDTFKSSLPAHLQENHIILGHVRIAEVLLYEVGIGLENQPPTSLITPKDRLELVWACLNAVKSFLDLRFPLEDKAGPRFICLNASDFLYAFIVALKLVTLNLPGWDLQMVRRHITLYDMLERHNGELEYWVNRRNSPLSAHQVALLSEFEANSRPDPMIRLIKLSRDLTELVRKETEEDVALVAGDLAGVGDDAVPSSLHFIDSTLWQGLFGGQMEEG